MARYTQLELIGESVWAKTYKALDTATNSPVAVKVLNPHLQIDEISHERFQREIQLVRGIDHPQVISIIDLVEGASPALVMEYVPDSTLEDYLRLHAPLDVETALDFLAQILQVLAVCHQNNLIHRDLNPQNILVGPGQRLRLLGFGIARLTSVVDHTQAGTSLGSPEYMAPELFAKSVFDPRTDLYAIGAVAYEMLTGELPFQSDPMAVLFHQHVSTPVPKISVRRGEVAAWLDDVIAKLLAKTANERYQTADEALADVAHQRVISKSFPELHRRDCLSCSRSILADLSICTFCGYESGKAFSDGGFNVVISPNEERERLKRFLEKVFRFKEKLPRRPDLLMSGIDRPSAELLKSNASKQGVFLTIKKMSSYSDEVRLVSSYFLLISAWMFLSLIYIVFMAPHSVGFAEIGSLMTMISVPVLATWGSYRFFVWTHRKPLFAAKRQRAWHEALVVILLETTRMVFSYTLFKVLGMSPGWAWVLSLAACAAALFSARRDKRASRVLFGQQPASAPKIIQLSADLQSELGWLKEIGPLVGVVEAEDQQVFISRLIEKYFLLCQHASDLERDLRDDLELLIKNAARVAGLVAEIEATIDGLPLAEWSREYLGQGGERKLVAATRLRLYQDLEVKKFPLMARLIHLQYALGTLVGRTLVFDVAPGEDETTYLRDSIAALRSDFAMGQEIRLELAELQ